MSARFPTKRAVVWCAHAAGAIGLLSVAACGGSRTPDSKNAGMMSPAGGETNVPPPPEVDRTKCDKAGKQVVTADTDFDRKPDVWKFYAPVQQGGQTVQVQTCKLVDLNHDGKVDMITSFIDSGEIEKEEMDLDFDGKFEFVAYYQGGMVVRKEKDFNLDQRPDVWEFFQGKKLVRQERDRNGDGRADEWQYYENGRLDRIGYDDDGSGKVTRWDRAIQDGEGEDDAAASAAPPPSPVPDDTAEDEPPPAPAADAASTEKTKKAKKAKKKRKSKK